MQQPLFRVTSITCPIGTNATAHDVIVMMIKVISPTQVQLSFSPVTSHCYSVMAESISGDATALQPAGWNQPCSEEHLAEISLLITDWRALSPFLGLTEAEEIAILGSNPHSVPAQKITMLRKWKQKRGANGTYKRLCRVF